MATTAKLDVAATSPPKPNSGQKKVKGQYSMYQNQGRYLTNRKKKLTRHIKAHPEDAVAKDALGSALKYRRKDPVQRLWSPERKEYAHTLRMLGYNGADIRRLVFNRTSAPLLAAESEQAPSA